MYVCVKLYSAKGQKENLEEMMRDQYIKALTTFLLTHFLEYMMHIFGGF